MRKGFHPQTLPPRSRLMSVLSPNSKRKFSTRLSRRVPYKIPFPPRQISRLLPFFVEILRSPILIYLSLTVPMTLPQTPTNALLLCPQVHNFWNPSKKLQFGIARRTIRPFPIRMIPQLFHSANLVHLVPHPLRFPLTFQGNRYRETYHASKTN